MQPYARRMRPALGTFVEIGCIRSEGWEAATEAAFGAIAALHQRLSFHDVDSELSRLNAAGGQWVELSASSRRVIAAAACMTQVSRGLFNCTVGGALVLRGLLPDHGHGDCVPVGSADDIAFAGRRVRLLRPVRITLDGIAKGWAVDRAVAALRAHDMRSGWVNAGGDLRAFGDVALPVSRRELDGRLADLGTLRCGALASSAALAQPDASLPGFIVGGAPARNARVWSVAARFAYRADALTKIAANAPDDAREQILQRLGGRLVVPR